MLVSANPEILSKIDVFYMDKKSNAINFYDDKSKVQQKPQTYERTVDPVFQTTNDAGCNAYVSIGSSI